ncbi:PREDICTED: uncharacterized protein LOC109236776 [Nicotiana attenuata]|uniref:uncharacterized protein LOC109236776 n=1 Tax=Nicotiana attenuata TaxID=49451 RepID=UPI000905CEFF|nr:PREDICTED: uncharacterized protein LOC109236776 [Nicotiana attenuata]
MRKERNKPSRWSILFNQYEITNTPQKVVKGQALANFLADHPLPAEWELSDEFPDEDVLFIEELPPWTLFFDGSARRNCAGAGETCSNNAAEYQALIVGLEMALEMKILMLEIYGDSKLIINQLLGNYEVKKEDLLSYHEYASGLLENFDRVFLNHVPREENCKADALANLATMMALGENESTKIRDKEQTSNEEHHDSSSIRGHCFDALLKDYSCDVLTKKKPAKRWRKHILESGPKLHFRIKRMGYYWATMVKDCMDHAKRCQACFHANYIHQPPEPLHPTVASWPFDAWGLDVVGPLPKSSKGQMYILAATDYFSRWAEDVPLKEVKKETVVDFIKSYIIFRYGIPRYIITDNGTPFDNKLVKSLCEKFGFKQHKSSMYNAPANGLAEAFNKTLKVVLPLEQQIPSLWIAIQEGLTSEENAQLRLAELEALDEKRLEAQQKLECYQARLARAFNKKVRPRSFQVGNLVLAIRRPIILNKRIGDKFTSKWDGPYVVKEAYSSGAYKIVDKDGLKDQADCSLDIPRSRYDFFNASMKCYEVKTAETHQVLARRSWKSLLQWPSSPACNNVIWYMSHSLAKDEIWSLELQASFSPSRKAEMHHVAEGMYQVVVILSRKPTKIRKDFGALSAIARRFCFY